jgi:protein PsiE
LTEVGLVAVNRYQRSTSFVNNIRDISHKVLTWVQDIGLLIIAVATLIAVGFEISTMLDAKTVTLADLLLLFIYLEVLAMIAIYLDSGQLPVRIPLYIAIVALARYLILDMKNLDTWRMLGVSGAVLIIAITVLVIRYGHNRFPYQEKDGS